MEAKKAKDSLVIMNELVMPNDTNQYDNLMGGRLMYWMDIAAALSSMKHSGRPTVTVSVDNLSFKKPIDRGYVIQIHAQITRAFKSSMEVHLKVFAENPVEKVKYQSNEAFYTFVALDENKRPVAVPQVTPETEEEIKLFEESATRRQIRLILSGKTQAQNASKELKSFFSKEQ